MEKRNDAQIYILGHKPLEYGYWDNSLYTPLQVGAAFNPQFLPVTDNTGDNIGNWNKVFAECSGTYWLWKNVKNLKYICQCQYRRRIFFEEDTDFDKIFNEYDAICTQPLNMGISVYSQLKHCHSSELAELFEKTVKELYPEMSESFDKYVKKSGVLFYSNSFGLRKEDFGKYAEFMTNVVFEVIRRIGCNDWTEVRKYIDNEMKAGRTRNTNGLGADKGVLDYQQQIGAFLSERLYTLWVRHTFDKILIVPYTKFENV